MVSKRIYGKQPNVLIYFVGGDDDNYVHGVNHWWYTSHNKLKFYDIDSASDREMDP